MEAPVEVTFIEAFVEVIVLSFNLWWKLFPWKLSWKLLPWKLWLESLPWKLSWELLLWKISWKLLPWKLSWNRGSFRRSLHERFGGSYFHAQEIMKNEKQYNLRYHGYRFSTTTTTTTTTTLLATAQQKQTLDIVKLILKNRSVGCRCTYHAMRREHKILPAPPAQAFSPLLAPAQPSDGGKTMVTPRAPQSTSNSQSSRQALELSLLQDLEIARFQRLPVFSSMLKDAHARTH